MTWFDNMAAAMRARETAMNGVIRWQAKLKNAEDLIAQLGAQAPATAATPQPAAVTPAAPFQAPANQAPADELPAA